MEQQEAKFWGRGKGGETQPKTENKKPRSLLIGSSYSTVLFTHSTHKHKNIFQIQLYTPYVDLSGIFFFSVSPD